MTGPARRGRSRETALVGGVDQALSALTNLGISLLAARSLAAHEFGSLQLALAAYAVLLGLSRASTSEQYLVRFKTLPVAATLYRRSLGGALGLGAAFAIAGTLLIITLPERMTSTLLPVGVLLICMPLLTVHDAARVGALGSGAPYSALALDGIWASGLAVILFVSYGSLGPAGFIVAWGGTAGFAYLLMLLKHGRAWLPRRRWWTSSTRRIGGQYAFEFLVMAAAGQFAVFFLAVVQSTVEVAAYRGGLIVFGPLNVLLSAAPMALLAVFGGETGSRDTGRLALNRRTAAWVSGGMGCVAAVYGGGILLLPSSALAAVLGESGQLAEPTLVFFAIQKVLFALSLGPFLYFRLSLATRVSVVVRAWAGASLIAFTSVGSLILGARGAAVGLMAAHGVALLLWANRFLRLRGVGASAT
jgi:hypothetical protein